VRGKHAPVDTDKLPLFIYMVLYISGGAGFLPSTVGNKTVLFGRYHFGFYG